MSHHAATAAAAEPNAGLPDVNRQTTPFPEVQRMLDETASFHLFAEPRPWGEEEKPTLTPYDPRDYFGIHAGYGVVVRSSLHRFDARLEPGRGLAVDHAVGSTTGSFRARWLVSLPGLEWTLDQEPPPAIYDPWRSQPFAMLDCELEIGDRGDGFRGYGLGRTFPVVVGGRHRVLAGGTGTLTGGRGRFAGLEATFSLNGVLIEGGGFRGDVSVRVPDPEGRLRTDSEIPVEGRVPFPDGDGTYLVMRGEKADPSVRTEYGPPPGPGLVSLVTPARMRAAAYPFTATGRRGLRARPDFRHHVADLEATVALDILAPPGTRERPNPFTTRNVYTFYEDGRTVGDVEVQVVEGRSFNLTLPGVPHQPAMRYGGFGPVVGGTGRFRGVKGLVSLNSAIGVAPHALSMINVLRLVDPEGSFRQSDPFAGGAR